MAHKGKTQSQSQIQVRLAPEPIPFPHTCALPCTLGFSDFSARGCLSSPITPTKLLRFQVVLHSPQMLSLHWGSSAQVKGPSAHKHLHWTHTNLADPGLQDAGCHPGGDTRPSPMPGSPNFF